MENLIEKYKEECDILSNVPSRLWKIGQIVIAIAYFYCVFKTKNYIIAFLLVIIIGIILYKICEYMELIDIIKKLNLKYKSKEILFKSNVREEIYKLYGNFQKDWITKYCKKNKLNNIEKLKILREELAKRNTSVKYINPVVIGTLMVGTWEIVIQKIMEYTGMINTVMITCILVFIISILTGIVMKELKENESFYKTFDYFSGTDRLQKLLVYRMLKVER